MTELIIALTPELEGRLSAAAAREGMPVEDYAASALEAVVPTGTACEQDPEHLAALQERYKEAGIYWTGRRLPPREPVARTCAGQSVAQMLLDDRR